MSDILFSGCRSGRYPLEYARKHPGDHIVVHAYDSYQARKVCEDNGRRRHNVEVVCAASPQQPCKICAHRNFNYT